VACCADRNGRVSRTFRMPLSPVDGPLGGDFDGWTRVMLAGIGQSLPIAVGLLLAAMPMVIIAVLLVVKRPARVTGTFVAGWMLGLAAAGGLVLLVADLVTLAAEPAAWASWVKIGLGVLLAGLAMRKWQARRAGP